MAVVVSAETFSSRFAKGSPFVGQHVWLDKELGLVTGTYPNADAKFDFAEETLVAVEVEREPVQKRRISHLERAPRKVKQYELETQTEIHTFGSATQLLVEGLNLVEDAAPGTLEILSKRKARSKRAVARTRADLYDVPHPDSHSQKLKSGFYVATNNKDAEARGYLKQAVELAGFKWGSDFILTPPF